MLRYPEVYTDLVFISVSTLPLELRCYKKISTDIMREEEDVQDGTFTTSLSMHVRSNIRSLQTWRKVTENEGILMDDIKQSDMGYDKVTQFSLRPCELKVLIKKVGDFYRWFYVVMDEKLTVSKMQDVILGDLSKSAWVDGLQRIVKLRENAIDEVMKWIEEMRNNLDHCYCQGFQEMTQVFEKIYFIITESDSILKC